ncbi:MAG TPA: hypothetical protein PLD93_06500, partial [Synergistaceae bacterium]|nr:hypothetical protein [Synergistaceae bacterium]
MNEHTGGKAVTANEARELQQRFRDVFKKLHAEIQQLFVGHDELVEQLLATLLAGGHVLIEGVPGLGKTLLVRT